MYDSHPFPFFFLIEKKTLCILCHRLSVHASFDNQPKFLVIDF